MKALVTQENVAAAAQHLVEAGQEPTLIAVQKIIGGGSYTTVKRYLDGWLATHEEIAVTVPMPDRVQQQANALVQRIWAESLAVGTQQIERAKDAAAEEIKAVHGALVTLEVERDAALEKLEQANAENATLTVAVQQLESDLQIRTAQLQNAEKAAREVRSEIMALRQQAMEHARLLGELDALRKQVHQQTVLIERLSGRG